MSPAFASYRGRAMLWWQARNSRERMLLTVLGALLLLLIFVMLLVRPLQATRATALADIRTYDTLAARLRAAGGVVATATPARSGDIGVIVRDSASRAGLASLAVTPTGAGAGIVAKSVDYAQLVRWLADLTAPGDIRVTRIALTRSAAPGTVDAVLSVTR